MIHEILLRNIARCTTRSALLYRQIICLITLSETVHSQPADVMKVWRRVRQTFQLRAGRVRQVVEEGYSLRAGRIVERARKDVKIDGERIDLG